MKYKQGYVTVCTASILSLYALLTAATAIQAGQSLAGLKVSNIDAKQECPTDEQKVHLCLSPIMRKWTGDFTGMVKRRMIRVLVVPSKTYYFFENGVPRGTSYWAMKAFEDEINRKLGKKRAKVHALFIPTSRDDLIPALIEGRGDIAAAGITITTGRREKVDFSMPVWTNVREIVVTGPQSPPISTLNDLAGKTVFVRKSSSSWEHLSALNNEFVKKGKSPVKLREAPEVLDDEYLLEMLNAGIFSITIMDNHVAALWAGIFTNIKPHPEIAVNTGDTIAWMFRKKSPELKIELDSFIKAHGKETAFGNRIAKRYLGNTRIIKNSPSPAEVKKFQKLEQIFRQYGSKYNMDYLLMMAQGYQESRLDHNVRSHAGALGIMQIMPVTGREINVGDIAKLEPNIHAGVKYMRSMVDKYFEKEPMDSLNKGLFALAAYNAGPGKIQQFRKEAGRRRLNPNVWFNSVEMVAAKKAGAETVTYVSNIYKYYVAYKLLTIQEERRKTGKTLKGK